MTRKREKAGSVLIETAVALPLFLWLCVGIFDVCRFFLAVHVAGEIAEQAARAGADPTVSDAYVVSVADNKASAMDMGSFVVTVDGRGDGGEFSVAAVSDVKMFVIPGGILHAKSVKSGVLPY